MSKPYSDMKRWLESQDGRRVEKMLTLAAELSVDAIVSHSRAKEEGTDYARRQYVRSVFAMIEGTIYVMKLLAKRPDIERFSAAELSLLSEESYDLNDMGKPIIRPHYLKLEKNIKFSFSMYAKSCDVSYILPVQEPGWNALKQSIKVRNRLMHPKNPGDLDVTNDELNNVEIADEWFNQKYRELQYVIIVQWLREKGFSSEAIMDLYERSVFRPFSESFKSRDEFERYRESRMSEIKKVLQ
jgi:hypothetical protein